MVGHSKVMSDCSEKKHNKRTECEPSQFGSSREHIAAGQQPLQPARDHPKCIEVV